MRPLELNLCKTDQATRQKHAIAKIYSSDRPSARLLRASALRVGNRIAPFKRAVAGFLADAN